jgi:hypothetical protein
VVCICLYLDETNSDFERDVLNSFARNFSTMMNSVARTEIGDAIDSILSYTVA